MALWRDNPQITFLHCAGLFEDQSFATMSLLEGGIRLIVVNCADYQAGREPYDAVLNYYDGSP